MIRLGLLFFIAFAALSPVGCSRSATSGKEDEGDAGTVRAHSDEESLNRISISASAEQRIGIETSEVALENVRQTMAVSGEVVVPTGQTVVVSAPYTGILSANESSTPPIAGMRLTEGQPVFRFTPVLSPERDVLTPAERVSVAREQVDLATARIDSDRQVETAKVQLEAAQTAYDRAERLLRNHAGSQKSLDEAGTQLKLAKEDLKTAQIRSSYLTDQGVQEQVGQVRTEAITSPVAGVLQSLDAATGETVSAGAPLFHVVKLQPIWVRVPIYVGRLRDVDVTALASISEFGRSLNSSAVSGRYVAAPPSADPNATTVDLFYELPNTDGQLYPGQKLAVRVPIKSTDQSLVVPWSAVLFDIHGVGWVYEKTAPQTYSRRRVDVNYVDNGKAVLAAGPPVGTEIVIAGGSELFGSEFGAGE